MVDRYKKTVLNNVILNTMLDHKTMHKTTLNYQLVTN